MLTTLNTRRAAALAGLALAVATPAAYAQPVPPGTVAATHCSTQAAGYTGLAGNKGATGWAWSGDLRIVTCVVRGTGGKIWATSRLAKSGSNTESDRIHIRELAEHIDQPHHGADDANGGCESTGHFENLGIRIALPLLQSQFSLENGLKFTPALHIDSQRQHLPQKRI